MNEVPFLPAAVADYEEALDWYLAHDLRTALWFEAAANQAAARIARFPLAGSRIDSRHRCVLLSRFPFSLVYRIENGGPVVVAVAHGKRSAKFWRGR